ncbi:hypothetical protein P879_09287 [Paragonimus westermani]|uniref:Uncharacterized protein n=1 Tax=Paragonimus westermani TaxID=34504 RepID=A0A8T0DC53_9TREM|nr:hypothetical protein P879_09287 [Paragonimus westermani]
MALATLPLQALGTPVARATGDQSVNCDSILYSRESMESLLCQAATTTSVFPRLPFTCRFGPVHQTSSSPIKQKQVQTTLPCTKFCDPLNLFATPPLTVVTSTEDSYQYNTVKKHNNDNRFEPSRRSLPTMSPTMLGVPPTTTIFPQSSVLGLPICQSPPVTKKLNINSPWSEGGAMMPIAPKQENAGNSLIPEKFNERARSPTNVTFLEKEMTESEKWHHFYLWQLIVQQLSPKRLAETTADMGLPSSTFFSYFGQQSLSKTKECENTSNNVVLSRPAEESDFPRVTQPTSHVGKKDFPDKLNPTINEGDERSPPKILESESHCKNFEDRPLTNNLSFREMEFYYKALINSVSSFSSEVSRPISSTEASWTNIFSERSSVSTERLTELCLKLRNPDMDQFDCNCSSSTQAGNNLVILQSTGSPSRSSSSSLVSPTTNSDALDFGNLPKATYFKLNSLRKRKKLA